nr:acyl-CoA N-acyltransferase [Tanacetum cinerariifolium]
MTIRIIAQMLPTLPLAIVLAPLIFVPVISTSLKPKAKSGLLERKKVKLDRGVSEGRDASKKSVDLSGLKHSKNKVVSSSSKKVEQSGSEKNEGNTKSGTKQVALVKGKEKQLLCEKIKKMLFGVGWTIDYRPRRSRDYLDSVYMSPSGTGYWSVTKGQRLTRPFKKKRNSLKDGKYFTTTPNEILSKLTRQTRQKEEKVSAKNKKHEVDSSKSKKAKVKVLKDVRKVSENKVREYNGEEHPLMTTYSV